MGPLEPGFFQTFTSHEASEFLLKSSVVVASASTIVVAVSKSVRGTIRMVSDSFKSGVDVHVRPLIDEVVTSIDGLSESMRSVQAQNTADHLRFDEANERFAVQLVDHESRLRDIHDRLVETEAGCRFRHHLPKGDHSDESTVQ